MTSSDDDEGETKHSYTDGNYWDDRYGRWATDPYDWLFQFVDVAQVVNHYLKAEDTIFVPGCGNAPLSPDMYDAGFKNQLCTDTSEVVIQQMHGAHSEKRPDMKWEVMDATETGLDDESFDAVVDKSLIDTLLCCENSVQLTTKMVDEFHRILKPDGIYITMSLHDEHDTMHYFKKPVYGWAAGHIYLRNPNYEEAKENTKYYLVAVCKKIPGLNAAKEKEFLEELSTFDQLATSVEVEENSQELDETVAALTMVARAYKEGKISADQRGELKNDILHGVPPSEIIAHLKKPSCSGKKI